ncbi:hypothetical protein [[Mycoplasma] testudinis]|uniref:hypothetical protein n=1 Tax=[Mycoplasma] testudinis TaxID=33924 RepID=UPI000481CCE4|nr:hypothetical protein [[Mycoplasma] testudinis]
MENQENKKPRSLSDVTKFVLDDDPEKKDSAKITKKVKKLVVNKTVSQVDKVTHNSRFVFRPGKGWNETYSIDPATDNASHAGEEFTTQELEEKFGTQDEEEQNSINRVESQSVVSDENKTESYDSSNEDKRDHNQHDLSIDSLKNLDLSQIGTEVSNSTTVKIDPFEPSLNDSNNNDNLDNNIILDQTINDSNDQIITSKIKTTKVKNKKKINKEIKKSKKSLKTQKVKVSDETKHQEDNSPLPGSGDLTKAKKELNHEVKQNEVIIGAHVLTKELESQSSVAIDKITILVDAEKQSQKIQELREEASSEGELKLKAPKNIKEPKEISVKFRPPGQIHKNTKFEVTKPITQSLIKDSKEILVDDLIETKELSFAMLSNSEPQNLITQDNEDLQKPVLNELSAPSDDVVLPITKQVYPQYSVANLEPLEIDLKSYEKSNLNSLKNIEHEQLELIRRKYNSTIQIREIVNSHSEYNAKNSYLIKVLLKDQNRKQKLIQEVLKDTNIDPVLDSLRHQLGKLSVYIGNLRTKISDIEFDLNLQNIDFDLGCQAIQQYEFKIVVAQNILSKLHDQILNNNLKEPKKIGKK